LEKGGLSPGVVRSTASMSGIRRSQPCPPQLPGHPLIAARPSVARVGITRTRARLSLTPLAASRARSLRADARNPRRPRGRER